MNTEQNPYAQSNALVQCLFLIISEASLKTQATKQPLKNRNARKGTFTEEKKKLLKVEKYEEGRNTS